MAYKQKGWSPFTQCSPGGICRPGGRRTNKWRHKWNKVKANVGEFFTKKHKKREPGQFDDYGCGEGCVDGNVPNYIIDDYINKTKPTPPKSKISLPPIDWDSEVYN